MLIHFLVSRGEWYVNKWLKYLDEHSCSKMSHKIWYEYLWWTDAVQVRKSWCGMMERSQRQEVEEMIWYQGTRHISDINYHRSEVALTIQSHALSLSFPLSKLVQRKGKRANSLMKRWFLSWVPLVMGADNLSLSIHFEEGLQIILLGEACMKNRFRDTGTYPSPPGIPLQIPVAITTR